MSEFRFFPPMSEAIRRGNEAEIRRLFEDHPKQLSEMTAFGTWLHYAAGQGSLGAVKCIIELGVDVNAPDHREGRLAIDAAASNGHTEVVRHLLDHGSRLDTSRETRNPLFGAIMGRSPEVVRLLLERGIDATVKYGPKSATGFALWQGQREIAHMIANHIAGGDPAKTEAILKEEAEIATRQGQARPTRILPTRDDLEQT